VARLASENAAARQAAAAEAETLKPKRSVDRGEKRSRADEEERLAHLAAELSAGNGSARPVSCFVKMARLKAESDMMNTAKEALRTGSGNSRCPGDSPRMPAG